MSDLLPVEKARLAAQKEAGYSHYWRLLPRGGSGVPSSLMMPPALRIELVKLSHYFSQLAKQAAEWEKKYPGGGSHRSRGQRVPFDVGQPDFFTQLDQRSEFHKAFRRWDYRALPDVLAASGQRRLAGMIAKLESSVDKKLDQAEKAYNTYSKHWSGYKGSTSTAYKAAGRYAKYGSSLVDGLLALYRQLEPLESDDDQVFGFTEAEWSSVVSAAKQIVSKAESDGISIKGPGGTGSPNFSGDSIDLNGDADKDEDYESFILEQSSDRTSSSFCKTQQRPYDAVVVSILAAAQKIAPEAISTDSDGGSSAIKRIYASDEENKMAASTVEGVVLNYLDRMNKGQDVNLTDMAADPSFRGLHFSRIERAAETLERKGVVGFDGVRVTKMASRIRSTWKEASLDKEAATGLYGYTKKTQKDVEATIRKVQKQATAIARSIYAKDRRVARFLQVHAQRTDSITAKLIMAGMKDIGPKFASVRTNKTASGSGSSNAKYLDSLPWATKEKILKHLAQHYGVSTSEMEDELRDSDAEALYEYTATDRPMTMRIYRDFERLGLRTASTTEKEASYGLYGFNRKVAGIGLAACTDLRDYVGTTAYDLHSRRQARYDRITGFLSSHSKKGKCQYSKLLLASYPDQEQFKVAQEEMAAAQPQGKKASTASDKWWLYSPEPKGAVAKHYKKTRDGGDIWIGRVLFSGGKINKYYFEEGQEEKWHYKDGVRNARTPQEAAKQWVLHFRKKYPNMLFGKGFEQDNLPGQFGRQASTPSTVDEWLSWDE